VIKAEFSASLLQSSVSHDPSGIILICIFVNTDIYVQDSINRKFKRTAIMWNRNVL